MTGKRFVDYFDKDHNYIIQDLQNEDEYQVGFVNCDEDVFLELINQLSDENERLKSFNQDLSENLSVCADKRLTQGEHLTKLNNENEQLKETNQELYDFRLVLNALLFNEWAETRKYEVYKSQRHHDGEPCFDGEWFIVVAILPSGQVTNHYHIKYWDYFKIPSYPKVKDEFDGHTSSVVLLRYEKVI